ncbi:MAG: TetR/AcrR family transcriptional regulator [Novosphingobium sp.]|nr:TetR/AcrR family transcriptional regulator [Novosphingobium sp.]MCP5403166.1 TetR/AcrR family transcriptional regulator [Novosphingobium sp.]
MEKTSQAQTRAERPSAKALATRNALLELAARMFAERGYVETSMRDIAKAASLTTGSLYGHFRNKADLLAEVLNLRIVDEFGADHPSSVDEENMRTGLASFAVNFPRREELRALIVQGAAAAQTDEETRNRLHDTHGAHLERWIAGYEHEREVLGIDPSVDLESAVMMTWAAEIGLGILEVLGISPEPKGWADAYDRLVRGLKLPAE